jgi:hypothetical protein
MHTSLLLQCKYKVTVLNRIITILTNTNVSVGIIVSEKLETYVSLHDVSLKLSCKLTSTSTTLSTNNSTSTSTIISSTV